MSLKKVKPAYQPSGSSGRRLSRFQYHEATRSFSTPPPPPTPPGWNASPLQGYPPALNSPVPIDTPGWREAPWEYSVLPGAIIGDGDRKSWDLRALMIWDNFSIFRTNCAILTSYIRADPRTCRGFSRGCCHVAWSNGESWEILLRIFHSDGREQGRD